MKQIIILILATLVLVSCKMTKEFYDSGELKKIGRTTGDLKNGEWKFYHKNGNREGVGKLDIGKLIGQWNWYHTNGKIYTERLYTDGKLMNIINCFDGNGKQLEKGTLQDGDGTLNMYDIEGKLLEVQNFKNGKNI